MSKASALTKEQAKLFVELAKKSAKSTGIKMKKPKRDK